MLFGHHNTRSKEIRVLLALALIVTCVGCVKEASEGDAPEQPIRPKPEKPPAVVSPAGKKLQRVSVAGRRSGYDQSSDFRKRGYTFPPFEFVVPDEGFEGTSPIQILTADQDISIRIDYIHFASVENREARAKDTYDPVNETIEGWSGHVSAGTQQADRFSIQYNFYKNMEFVSISGLANSGPSARKRIDKIAKSIITSIKPLP